MRLNWRASVKSQFGPSPGCTDGFCGHWLSSSWSARKRCPQARQSTSGSVKDSRWPDASQVRGCCRMAESRPTMSSRSMTIACHHASLMLRRRATP